MSDTPLFPYAEARSAADEVYLAISSACERVEIAGSLRRKKAAVHDIDLVVWPRYERVCLDLFGADAEYHPTDLVDALRHSPARNFHPANKIIRFDWFDFPVELYLAEPDGSNFEALWQMRTGSEQFNIGLASRAVRMHLTYRAGYGIFNPWNQRVDDGTERGIFATLGLDWVDPERRGQ